MLFFDDDSFPKIRRSLLIVCALITFVAHYEIGINLDNAILDTGIDGLKMSPTNALYVLGAVFLYLQFRFWSNLASTYILHRAGLTTASDVTAAADHYRQEMAAQSAQLEKIKGQMREHEARIAGAVEQYISAKDKVDELVTTIQKMEDFPRSETAAVSEFEHSDFYRNYISTSTEASAALSTASHDIGRLMKGTERLPEIMALPEVQSFELKKTGERRADQISAFDQFGLSVGFVLLASTFAVWFVCSYFSTH